MSTKSRIKDLDITIFSSDMKRKIIDEYLQQDVSQSFIMQKYNIKGHSLILNWIRQFDLEAMYELKKAASMKKSIDDKAILIAENQEQTNLKVVVLLLCSSMGLLSIMLGLTEADGIEAVLYTILGVIFISFIFVFFYFQKKKETKELEKKYLKQLYEYLEKNNYNITAIGFASYSGLPPDKAREVIESVAIKTGISPEIDENGKIHYNFK